MPKNVLVRVAPNNPMAMDVCTNCSVERK